MRKKMIASAVAAIAVSAIYIPTANAITTDSSKCSEVQVVSVNGTGSSSTKKDVNTVDDPIAIGVLKEFPNQSTAYNTPYPASVEALGSFGIIESDMPTTFGDSRLLGDQAALDHMNQYKTACPNTKFIITGYSQGASVAGDVAALIANGASKNVTSDDILAVYLMADPGRSGNSNYSGPSENRKYWAPLPPNAQYQRNGEYASATQRDGTVGWTGQRSLSFKGLEGKIISICNDQDLACSAEENSFYRKLADISDKDILVNDSYRNGDTGTGILIGNPLLVINTLLGSGFSETILAGGTVDEAIPKAKAYIENADADDKTKGTLNNALNELSEVFKLMHEDDLFGKNVSDLSILAHILKTAAPNVNLPIPSEQQAMIQNAITTITSAAPAIPSDVEQRVDPIIQYIAKFPTEHGSYFGNYKIGDQTASDWAISSAIQGVRNYLNNTPLQLDADSDNNGTIEVAESDRADDGLHYILEGKERPVLTDDQEGQTTTPNSNSNSNSNSTASTTTGDIKDIKDVMNNLSSSSKTTSSDNEDDYITTSSSGKTNGSSPITGRPTVTASTISGASVDTGGSVKTNMLGSIKSIFA